LRTYSTLETLIGILYIVVHDQKLAAIHLGLEDFLASEKTIEVIEDNKDWVIIETISQLNDYFSGKRTVFDLPLERKGTEFQMAVWNRLEEIPFGETKSYLDIANEIGRPKAVRAIGQANKANKLPIIVPCHRVIGKNQRLMGYAGTRTDIKEQLLRLEGANFKSKQKES
jgi:methylated-DNA-[protein]-cysteine S-methyltransferase